MRLLVEVDRKRVESFAARRDPVALSRQRVARRRGSAAAVQHSAAIVGEHDTVRRVRVAFDAQLAPVVQPMVVLAEAEQVGSVGAAPVLPCFMWCTCSRAGGGGR